MVLRLLLEDRPAIAAATFAGVPPPHSVAGGIQVPVRAGNRTNETRRCHQPGPRYGQPHITICTIVHMEPQADDSRTMRERMLAGDPYIADDPENARRAQRGVRLADAYHRAAVEDESAARPILDELLGHLGEDAFIKPPLFVDYGEHISVGPRTFINYNLVALDVAPITIGADCQIGPNVQLLTPTHPIEPGPRRDKWEAAKPITIGDNVWLGGGAIVLPGVTIGDNTVVGAGAVVTRDLPANVIALGNPARVIRSIEVGAAGDESVTPDGDRTQ